MIRIHALNTSGTYSTILHGGGHGVTEVCHYLLLTSFVAVACFVMQGVYLFLYNKGVFVFSHPSTGVIRCADSLFPIEEVLSIFHHLFPTSIS